MSRYNLPNSFPPLYAVGYNYSPPVVSLENPVIPPFQNFSPPPSGEGEGESGLRMVSKEERV